MKRALFLAICTCICLAGCRKQLSPSIEGKWVQPHAAFMGQSLALDSAKNYSFQFWSEMVDSSEIPENPKTGTYHFDGDWLSVPVLYRYHDGHTFTHSKRFKRETINGVEVLLRNDAEEIWRRCGMIYTGGLLIKVSDDPKYVESQDEPTTKSLFKNGVMEWSREAEAGRNRAR